MHLTDQINRTAAEAIEAIEQARTKALETIVQQQHDLMNAKLNLTKPVVVAGIKWGSYLTPSDRCDEPAKFNPQTGLWYMTQRSLVLHAYEQNLRPALGTEYKQLHNRTSKRDETVDGMPYKVFTDQDTGQELWLSFAGLYNFEEGAFYNVTENGYYWSSSVYNATHGLHFGFTSSWVYPQGGSNRSLGFPVRCVSSVP